MAAAMMPTKGLTKLFPKRASKRATRSASQGQGVRQVLLFLLSPLAIRASGFRRPGWNRVHLGCWSGLGGLWRIRRRNEPG